ncbi:MAG: hypothetical protein QNJ44_22840 [Rhodobacter sp.]|nr:hypothetical protein [Rhodobacter sp.]
MSATDKTERFDPRFHDLAEEDFRLEPPLGFVRQEPLASMLKVVREPPPMFEGPQSFGVARPKVVPTEGVAMSQKKLTATGLILDLAHLVISREGEIEASGDPLVQQGLEEVYRFLLNSEQLSSIRQT